MPLPLPPLRRAAARERADRQIEDDPDEPGTYDAAYEPVAIDGETAVATGSSTYTNPDGSIRAVYDNCFLLRFDADRRCTEFTEWFVKRPEGSDA